MFFLLNKQENPIDIRDYNPHTTILEFLRQGGKCGTKEGCTSGDCGACVAMMGKVHEEKIVYESVNTCISPLGTLANKHLITIEGIGGENDLHPVQEAMARLHASQCGFCTSGFVASLACAYENETSLDEPTIEQYLSGNLCRCTGYLPIIESAKEAFKQKSPSYYQINQSKIVQQLQALPHTLQYSYQDKECFFPSTTKELETILQKHPKAKLIAGSTDIGVEITQLHKRFSVLVFLKNIASLNQVIESEHNLELYANTSIEKCLNILITHYPHAKDYMLRFASKPIRSQASVAGNIANASPIGDLPPLFVALGATIALNHYGDIRTLSLEKFFLDYKKTALKEGEFIVSLTLPKLQNEKFWAYKISKRFEDDISAISLACKYSEKEKSFVLAFGGMASMVKVAIKTQEALARTSVSETFDFDAISSALAQDFSPLDDVRASKEYRLQIAAALCEKIHWQLLGKEVSSLAFSHSEENRVSMQDDTSAPHESGISHVCGTAPYIDDMPTPRDTLHVAFALSPVACGEIESIDISQALGAIGVQKILLAKDIEHLYIGAVRHDEPLLASKEVLFHGQAIAAVLADSYENAKLASLLIETKIKEKTPIATIQDAIKANSYHDKPIVFNTGEAVKTLANAKRKLKGQLLIGAQEHFYLESQIALATINEKQEFTVHSSTQNPTEVQHLVADVLGVPMHSVEVVTRRMGGGFGGKETHSSQVACVSALFAKLTGRSVKTRLGRQDDFLLTGKRHNFEVEYEVCFDEQGKIEGIVIDFYAQCGYSLDLSYAITSRTLFHADNAYYLPNVLFRGHLCKTNTVSSTAFRGFGGPQGMLAIENIVQQIAQELGIDALSVRKNNYYQNTFNNTTPYGQIIQDNIINELTHELEITAKYEQRRGEINTYNAQNEFTKKGLALSPVKFGISFTTTFLNQAGALVIIYKDGSIYLNHGGTEMGQGLFTKVAGVVAHEFGVSTDSVKSSATNTSKVPNTSATAASSGTDMNAMAAKIASERIKHNLLEFAQSHFDVNIQEIIYKNNEVQLGDKTLSFKEFINLAYFNRVELFSNGFYKTPNIHYDAKIAKGNPFYYYAYGVAMSEVLLDTITGEYKLHKVDILHDVGKSLNVAIDKGQIVGGFVQGMGWLGSEEIKFDKQAKLLSVSPANYKIPSLGDVPKHFQVQIANSENTQDTIYKSKAVGEPPFMLAISMWLAIGDALHSVSKKRVELNAPATFEEVFMCLQKAKQEGLES